MTTTPILSLPQVASNQNQKEATINSALAILEAAGNDVVTIDLSAGATTLSADQYTRAFLFVLANANGPAVVSLPTTKRLFAARNTSAYSMTLRLLGVSGQDLVVGAGQTVVAYSDTATLEPLTSGLSRLADLGDVAASSPSDGQVLSFDASSNHWGPVDLPADLGGFVEGKPAAGARVAARLSVRRARYLPDLAGSQASVTTAPAATAVFKVMKGAAQVGSFTFVTGQTTATFETGGSAVTVVPGDLLAVVAPAAQDGALAGLVFNLKGAHY